MAFGVQTKHWVLASFMICISFSGVFFGKADEEIPETGPVIEDPTQIVDKALLCFNDNYIYSSCEEEYRLSQSGSLNVPPGYTDQFCSGPCLEETHLVLKCIENIFQHFVFYNKATIHDIKDTVEAGCGHGSERGNFNVEEHIAEENNGEKKIGVSVMAGVVWTLLSYGLLV